MLYRVAVLLALVVTYLCTTVFASHFLGAIFMVRSLPGNTNVTNVSQSWVTVKRDSINVHVHVLFLQPVMYDVYNIHTV